MIKKELSKHLKRHIVRYLAISFLFGVIAAPTLNLVTLIILAWAGFSVLLLGILVMIISKFKKKYSIISGMAAGILIMITGTALISLLLFMPAKLAQRYLIIGHADKIIKYVEAYKVSNGEYPDIDVNQIASPKVYGIDQYFYFTKRTLLKTGKDKSVAKKNDFFEIGFRQYGLFIDSDVVLYRSDKDYSSHLVDLRNAPRGWKYYLDHF